ncbi:hypothetical protein LJR129_004035 [Acidovorax sp. LjRoot129]
MPLRWRSGAFLQTLLKPRETIPSLAGAADERYALAHPIILRHLQESAR